MPSKNSTVRAGRERKDTRGSLLAAAERLFARDGIGQVPLDEIARKAGLANKFAVQYHFGDRDQLVRSVFERRLPKLDARRAELLKEIKSQGALADTAALYEVMIRPVAEIVEGGRHSYAAFLLAVYEFDRSWILRSQAHDLSPFTDYVRELLAQTVPQLSRELFLERHHLATLVFLDMIVRMDSKKVKLTTDHIIRRAVSLGIAILTAPITV